jgi:hypothetical protein
LRQALVLAALAGSVARAEFILPIAGEEVSVEPMGVVFQAAGSAATVELRLAGPTGGIVQARYQGDGLWRAQIPGFHNGAYTLTATVKDSTGKIVSETIRFQAGTPELSVDAATSGRWNQNVFLGGGAGWRQGLSEGTTQERRDLDRLDGALLRGSSSTPLDNQWSGNAHALYMIDNGPITARFRIEGDLRENEYEQGANQYSADLGYGSWSSLHLGDQAPSWDPLLVDGARMRGVGLDLSWIKEEQNLVHGRIAYGLLRRSTPGWEGITTSDDTSLNPGTWERHLLAGQIGFGSGEQFLLNITALSSWDKADPVNHALQDTLQAPPPAENFGMGLDIHWWFSKRRFEAFASGAVSAVTENRETRSFSDSTQADLGLSIPGMVTSILPVNSTVRGSEKLMNDPSNWVDANSAWKFGMRYRESFGQDFSIREEVKGIHKGADFESFARILNEATRTGAEWNQSFGFLARQLNISSTLGWYVVPDMLGGDRDEFSGSLALVFSNMLGSYYANGQMREQTSDSGSGYTAQGLNTGVSHSWNPDFGTLITRVGYGLQNTESRTPGTKVGVVQNSADAQVRVRPGNGNWEPRITYQFIHQDFDHTQSHRMAGGFGARLLQRRLDLQFDGGATQTVRTSSSRWARLDESGSVGLSIGETTTLRLSEQTAWMDPRGDARVDLTWETIF